MQRPFVKLASSSHFRVFKICNDDIITVTVKSVGVFEYRSACNVCLQRSMCDSPALFGQVLAVGFGNCFQNGAVTDVLFQALSHHGSYFILIITNDCSVFTSEAPDKWGC